MDLAFLLDASGSIGRENYQRVKTFVSDIIDYFAVSQKGNGCCSITRQKPRIYLELY